MWNMLRETLLPSASCEQDPGFREVLQDVARRGVQVAAVLGVIVVLMFVTINAAFLGRSVGLTYDVGVVVLWDKLLLMALAVGGLLSVRFLRLDGIRLLAAGIVAAATLASVADDIAGGDTSFSQGYLALIYLLAVLAVPFRPLQTVGLGLALGSILFGAVEMLPAVFGTPAVPHFKAHYVYLATITVVLAGMSGLLYTIRYAQYRDRRAAEELRARVESLEAAKSRFFINVSHEFRTPLTLLRAPLDDMLAGRYGEIGAHLHRRLGEMRIQARNLNALIDQLLDLSKLEDGTMPLKAREYDLIELVRRYADSFQSALERREITLGLDLPLEPVCIWCDAEKLERVVSNLLSNAMKFTQDGGTIRIRLSRSLVDDREQVVLAVRDNGKGIDSDILPLVFDRFAAAGTPRPGQVSTGIGLALVKEIVARHGGSVAVASEPGFGTEFTVRLPVGSEHLDPEDIASEPLDADRTPAAPDVVLEIDAVELDADPPAHPPDVALVVIVDDNAAVRNYLRDLLFTRYRVETAADAEEGFRRICETVPALVISDVMMPGGGGFELCRRIKRDERLADVPVVLLTARGEDEARREGFVAGADAYLAKPFSSDELLIIAENLIGVRRLLRDRMRLPEWATPSVPTISSHRAEFLERVHRVTSDHLGDSAFGVEWLADEVGLSTRQLQRRLKETTHLTAAGFIKAMRLDRAAQLLTQTDLQVQEVSCAVGYRDVNYFSRMFHQVYGLPPSEYGGHTAGGAAPPSVGADRPMA